ncbi:hypothetical protein EC957_000514 [Mortierella hygrophila]|uniref:F-box domain-containing protein n=1 Tax=Mortierella hygrophila TaxID=979708 RepID=A0A9P6K2W2_9FUNG|nr:hypothetical protein EC957_000514 [Mortierella hygrophila]
MHSRNQHHLALELPEILHRIGEYLPRRDLVTSFQVCSSFHSSLAPLLYRELDLACGTSNVSSYGRGYESGRSDGNTTPGHDDNNGDIIHDNNDGGHRKWEEGRRRCGRMLGRRTAPTVLRDRYAPLVRRIKLETSLAAEYLSVGFTHLTTITLSYNGESSSQKAGVAPTTAIGAGAGAGVAGGKRRRTKWPTGEGSDIKDNNEVQESDQDEKDTTVDNTKALVQLVQDNKDLVSWTFEKFRTSHFSAEVWKAIVEAAQDRLESKRMPYGNRTMSVTAARTGLELLEVKQMTVDKESGPWFVKACRLAKVLKLVVVDLTHANLLYTQDPVLSPLLPPPLPQLHEQDQGGHAVALIPPMAQEINMWSLRGFSFMDQLRFLVECSQARSIAWSSPCAQWRHDLCHLSIHDLETLINPNQHQQRQQRMLWPHLHSLRFSEWLRGKIDPTDMSALGTYISTLLTSITSHNQIRFFRLSGAKMHSMAVPILQQHHNLSLNHIRLRGCPSATSTMIQGLLESCPNLTTLTANILSIDAISRGKPWICKSLIEFQVYLDLTLEPAQYPRTRAFTDRMQEAHLLVFARLATLPALERLLISRVPTRGNNAISRKENAHSLNLRLSCGLDTLSTLKKLKVLNFVDVEQVLDKDSVQWMISSWPNLGCVQGMLAPSLEQSSALAALMTNHGVYYSCA